jgi:hypothetical protein
VIKAKLWSGQGLKGDWQVTRKLDGVRALKGNNGVVSRAGKPLHNLNHCDFSDAEVFLGNWEDTISAVRTLQGVPVPQNAVYNLDPLDPRLDLGTITNPSAEDILHLLEVRLASGEEGVVLRQGDTWLKVKAKETYDVTVLGVIPGQGKYLGRMGALLTEYGKVGTGFTDKMREELMGIESGTVIEVGCMGLTPSGKFRHPRFVRVRYDK